MDASIALMRQTFAGARLQGDRAVVPFQQADMFESSSTSTPAGNRPSTRLVQAIVDESGTFAGEVHLIDGHSHRFHVDKPVATGSRWLGFHGVTGAADNLTRITVDGEALNELPQGDREPIRIRQRAVLAARSLRRLTAPAFRTRVKSCAIDCWATADARSPSCASAP